MSISINKIINSHADPTRAKASQKYFKTGKGEYAEGDIFIGLTVPQCRKIAKDFSNITLPKLQKLLHSKMHEERLIALLILVYKYEHDSENKESVFNFYIKSSKQINNWDLVDLSAPKIFGRHILNNKKKNFSLEKLLFEYANSENLWEKRIAIVSTLYFITNKRFNETLKICEILMSDKHDLIHKACGWMLREIGKRDIKTLENFLKKHYKVMPRTMLRYAIERFPENKRQAYLKGKI